MANYQRRSIYVGDIKTHLLEAGSGPDLVLLHGGEYGASAEITWRHNIDELAKRFHVIAPDMLGWGGTDKIYNFSDPAGYRIRHIKRLLEILGVAKAFLSATPPAAAPSCAPPWLILVPFKYKIWSPFAATPASSKPSRKETWKTTRRRWRTWRKS
jgi:hypothetical protein